LLLFADGLTPEQRTPVRDAGLLKARSGAAELLASAIGIVAQGVGPDNARLMSAALKDTRDVWATYLLSDDRKQILGYLAKATEIVTDAGVKADLMAVGGTFSAVKSPSLKPDANGVERDPAGCCGPDLSRRDRHGLCQCARADDLTHPERRIDGIGGQ
jgi:hypothetical protein